MPSKSEPHLPRRRDARHQLRGESPLLRILVAEATRRNWTLARLAKALGVSYERLAQYRRADADIANATRATLESAASLLGVPLAGIYVLAGKLAPSDFLWPSQSSLRERINKDLEQLASDPLFAAFVGEELARADVKVQYLVALLYREVAPSYTRATRLPEWLRALQLATAENTEAQATLAALRAQSPDGQ